MKQLLLLLLSAPIFLQAQEKIGIKFEEGLTWQQVKQKAKAENKYIFMDCYATWCGPCRLMDENIYAAKKVGEFMNDKFISIKVQFDKTKSDNEYTRSWYNDIDSFLKQYNLTGYPTYLFFSPGGDIVHRDMGARLNEDLFIDVARSAFDTSKQYYKLLADYESGKRPASLKNLALSTLQAGNNELAFKIASDYLSSLNKDEIFKGDNLQFAIKFQEAPQVQKLAKDYKRNYLDKLQQSHLLTRDNLNFIGSFSMLVNSKDQFFKLFYEEGNKVDNAIDHQGFADGFVRYIIGKEEITNKLYKNGKPITNKVDWKKISETISNKYNKAYAEDIVPKFQLRFYENTRNWKEFARIRDEMIKHTPPKNTGTDVFNPNGTWMLNMAAWTIFLHCDDRQVLSRGLAWVELAIRLENPNPNDQYLDTRANILYKLGRVKEAIAQEEIVLNSIINNIKKTGKEPSELPVYDVYVSTLTKMKKGEPTWDISGEN